VCELLYAFGDSPTPLPSTAACLDEILTDFIIETCHAAALCASYSRRQKIKVDDFRWVLRRNPIMLGRVQEQLARGRHIQEQRKGVDVDQLGGGGGEVGGLTAMAGMAGVEETEMKYKGPGRGRRKRKAEDDGSTKPPAAKRVSS
jgi:transcription initiation factor TFIID subunit 13